MEFVGISGGSGLFGPIRSVVDVYAVCFLDGLFEKDSFSNKVDHHQTNRKNINLLLFFFRIVSIRFYFYCGIIIVCFGG